MVYRKFGDAFYIRMDRGDEIIACVLELCRKEGVDSATFSCIGGCSEAELQTFLPEKGEFESNRLTGMLELLSMNGNVVRDEQGEYFHHTHAVFSYKENGEHRMSGGHLRSCVVLYTAEMELRPVIGGVIKRTFDPETGTGFWDLS